MFNVGFSLWRAIERATVHSQPLTSPSHRTHPSLKDVFYSASFMQRTYHFFEFTSFSTSIWNSFSANSFLSRRFSSSSSLSRLASLMSNWAYLRFQITSEKYIPHTKSATVVFEGKSETEKIDALGEFLTSIDYTVFVTAR